MINKNSLWETAKNKFKIQQIREEWEWLINEAELKPDSNILEIGAHSGGSSYYLNNFAKNMITIDIHNPSLFDYSEFKGNYEYIPGDSHSSNITKNFSKYKWDFVFIDGDHSYTGVRADFYNVLPHVEKGTKIAFHDIVISNTHHVQDCYVGEFWEELKQNLPYTTSFTKEFKSTDLECGIGIIII